MKARIVLHLILSFIFVGICSSLASGSTSSGDQGTSPNISPQIDPSVNIQDFGGAPAPFNTNTQPVSQAGNTDSFNPEVREQANQVGLGGVNDHNQLGSGIENAVGDFEDKPFSTDDGLPGTAHFSGDPQTLGQ